jgi:hypothetical protein
MFLFGMLCLVLGILVKYLKCYWLISGYNTMSAEKRLRVDIKGLGNFLGNSLFVLAGLMIATGLFLHSNLQMASTIAILAIFPLIIYLLIKAQRFDGNTRNADGTMTMAAKAVIGIVMVTFIAIGIFILLSARPTEVLISDEAVQIKGLYGIDINRNEISGISLTDAPPDIVHKTNGFNLGAIFKGHFLLRGGVKARLYVNIRRPPFIEITTSKGLIIINQGDLQKTEALFLNLLSKRTSNRG